MNLNIRVIGLVWYRQENYAAILQIMTDAANLPATYTDWLKHAEQTEQRLKSQGHITVKAYIDPATFPGWCRTRGLNIDAKARMDYANAVAYETARGTH